MYEETAFCTWLIIILTGVVSYLGFRSSAIEDKYIFNPQRILAGKEYYRLVSSGFLHADWRHLIGNMLSLYFFAPAIELGLGKFQFLLIYFGAIVGGDLLSLYIHRNHEYYSYGASGGVCGVIFSHILLSPGGSISVYFLPSIPNWLYAIVFIAASFYGMKENNRGNVGHDAHLGGAFIGFLITAGLHPEYARENARVFFILSGSTLAVLIYLWFNPLILPIKNMFHFRRNSGIRRREFPSHKREALEVDAILEKISRTGFDSLSKEEKSRLEEVSGKYQRRGESNKPESGLTI